MHLPGFSFIYSSYKLPLTPCIPSIGGRRWIVLTYTEIILLNTRSKQEVYMSGNLYERFINVSFTSCVLFKKIILLNSLLKNRNLLVCVFLLLLINDQLTLSRQRSLSCRNQSIYLPCKSMDWFLYDRDYHHERVNRQHKLFTLPMI